MTIFFQQVTKEGNSVSDHVLEVMTDLLDLATDLLDFLLLLIDIIMGDALNFNLK